MRPVTRSADAAAIPVSGNGVSCAEGGSPSHHSSVAAEHARKPTSKEKPTLPDKVPKDMAELVNVRKEAELTDLASHGLYSVLARYQVATQLVDDLEEDFNRHLAHVKANGAVAFERIREELQTFVTGVASTATSQSSRALDLQKRVEEARLLSLKIRELHVVTAMTCQPVPAKR